MNWNKRDQKHVWHPFTQMKLLPDNLPIVKAKGVNLFTDNGDKVIDAISSWWVNVHGHGHPYIQEKLNEQFGQLDHTIFAGFTHPKAVELSERIIEKYPADLQKVFFSDDGSTAVEVGIKMALQYFYNNGKPKTKMVAFNNAYHGDTFGAMSVGGKSPFNAPFDSFLFEVERIDIPTPENREEVIEQFRSLVKNGDVACFIFEPLVQGSAGMVMYDPKDLDALLDICDEYGVLKFADEVMTGFGRTGKLFSMEYCKNQPDIVSLSKGLTGGVMPLSLTLCTEKIYQAFHTDDRLKTFFHGHSFTGNALGCSVSCASLDLFERKETQENMARINAKHLAFAKKLEDFDLVENVRVLGTIIAFDVTSPNQTNYFNNLRDGLYFNFLEQGVLMRPLGNVLYILPPYCITDEELDYIYGLIPSTIEKVINNEEAAITH